MGLVILGLDLMLVDLDRLIYECYYLHRVLLKCIPKTNDTGGVFSCSVDLYVPCMMYPSLIMDKW